MQVHEITLYVLDFEKVGATEAAEMIESARYPNRAIQPDVMKVETAEIGEWSDDHPLNEQSTYEAELERLFPDPPPIARTGWLP